MIDKFFIIIVALILLACYQKQQHKIPEPSKRVSAQPLSFFSTGKPASFFGRWVGSHSNIFYSSNLTLNKDGTFYFSERGCLGQGYSEGTWLLEGNVVELTSYHEFKDQENYEIAERSWKVYLNHNKYLLERDFLFLLDKYNEKSYAAFIRVHEPNRFD